MTDPIAIDLSHHNTVTSFTSVASAGVIAVIHKASEGTSYVDDKYASRRKAALDAGLSFCSYHFLKHGKVLTQMEHYIATAKPVNGERVVIDYEDAACTLDDLTDAVRALQAISERDVLNLQITVYSGHLIKDQIGNDCITLLADNTSLWLAQYGPTPSWPKGTWPNWTLWQYTDSGTVPGISGNVDCNRFNGSDTNAAAWFAPASSDQPEPAPEPEPQAILVAITVPPGAGQTPVVVTINGNIITSG